MNIDSKLKTALLLSIGIFSCQNANAEAVINVIEPKAYYETNLSLKAVVQDDLNDEHSTLKIMTESHSHKSLINMAQDQSVKTRIDKNIVMAFRMEDCYYGNGRWVVYDKLAHEEKKSISETFSLFNDKVIKSKDKQHSEFRYYSTGHFYDTDGNDYSINSGEFTVYGTAKFKNEDCPASISGSLLGVINISFWDDIDGQSVHQTIDALIASGSTFSAKIIKP